MPHAHGADPANPWTIHWFQSPGQYLKRLRVHRAAQLLDTTNLPIKDIAGEVGYQDALYFSRVFRQVHEQSPMAFRGRPHR